ncbi:hypothetical protein Dda_6672 [Drechslerella dactyloides]|uniref:Uncharacterized protein n=1 Tax=Drechslerella dactyloides TaxID=74499 RepID=A0AAD6NHM1_DREDA|nr:hypothetical protein Dda_6672 [Drechslerella dactyloides]
MEINNIMKRTVVVGLVGLVAAANAMVCKNDVCLQALQASSRIAQASDDCSSFIGIAPTTTWTLATRTFTTFTTVTLTNTVTPLSQSSPLIAPRAVSSIPDYATACFGNIGYLSACSCIGVSSSTTTTTSSSSSTTTTSSTSDVSANFTVTATATTTIPVPGLYIATPTPLLGNLTDGSPLTYDEDFSSLQLPFPIRIYNTTLPVNASLYISVNGFISTAPPPNATYNNTPLPGSDTDILPAAAICPLWSDLLIESGEQQGIVYGVSGNYPSRTLTIEWLVSSWATDEDEPRNHFILSFLESDESVVLVRYFSVSARAASGGTVGLQSLDDGGKGYEWTYAMEGRVYPNLTLTVDMDANRITGTS